MKRAFFLLLTLALCSLPAARAQDAATQERLEKLTGRVEDLTARNEALQKQVNELNREMAELREKSAQPTTTYARPEDLNRLAQKLQEVDRARIEDASKTQAALMQLRKALEAPPTSRTRPNPRTPTDNPGSTGPTTPLKGVEYVIKPGDTLDAIVASCKEQKVNVTVAQILKANPGLKPERLVVGKKIFIPAPQP